MFRGADADMSVGPNSAGRGWDQQGTAFSGAPGTQGYVQGPGVAGYGRGQNTQATANWPQSPNASFGNGFGGGGYQT